MACPRGASVSNDRRQPLPRRDPQLPRHEVDAGDQLGHAMLDLQPGVHLQEVVAAVGSQEELDGRRVVEVDRARDGPRGLEHAARGGVADGVPATPRPASGADAGRSSPAPPAPPGPPCRSPSSCTSMWRAGLMRRSTYTVPSPNALCASRRAAASASGRLGRLRRRAHATAPAAGRRLEHRPGYPILATGRPEPGRTGRRPAATVEARDDRHPAATARAARPACCPAPRALPPAVRRRPSLPLRPPARKRRSPRRSRIPGGPPRRRCAPPPPPPRRCRGTRTPAQHRRSARRGPPAPRAARPHPHPSRRRRSRCPARGRRAGCAPRSRRGWRSGRAGMEAPRGPRLCAKTSAGYSGMLECFFGGSDWRLPSSRSQRRDATRPRVSEGRITSST